MTGFSGDLPLHQLQPLGRFSDRAKDYARFRPTYPTAAIAAILDGLGNPTDLIVADVGAGTGISSRLLAEHGLQVWAIEPNESMQQVADPHPRVTFLTGTAEQTGLLDQSVDLVTCFQAFHWFDPAQALPELRRILKPSGRLAVIWNDRDRSAPFTQSYSQIIQQVSGDHPAEHRMVAEKPLLDSAEFGNIQHLTFSHQQALDWDGLMGRANSSSYIPKDPQSQQQLITALEALYTQWVDAQGLVYLTYCTQVFLGESTKTNRRPPD
jgi:ubiquinone/menaquinone biosynthesis C-methylase UbiE